MPHRTAITRKNLSAPALWLCQQDLLYAGVNGLDYGCGKGFDADFFRMAKYDPHYQPVLPLENYDVITCIYVLNVVPENLQNEVMLRIRSLLTPEGIAYFAVRRDIPREGTQTQRWVELDSPSVYLRKGHFEIYQYR